MAAEATLVVALTITATAQAAEENREEEATKV